MFMKYRYILIRVNDMKLILLANWYYIVYECYTCDTIARFARFESTYIFCGYV